MTYHLRNLFIPLGWFIITLRFYFVTVVFKLIDSTSFVHKKQSSQIIKGLIVKAVTNF